MREVLQNNRGADHGGRPFHDLLRPGAFQAQHGESLVDVPRPFHPLQLLGNNHPVHDLRNLHEAHAPFHHDHGQRRAERGHAQGVHAARAVSDDFHNQAGGSRFLQ